MDSFKTKFILKSEVNHYIYLEDLKSLNIPLGFPGGSVLAISLCFWRHGFSPRCGKTPWRRNGDLLQYSCLEIFLTCSTQESFSLFSGKWEFIFIASFHLCCTLKIRLKANYKWVLFFFFFFLTAWAIILNHFSLQVARSYPLQTALGGLASPCSLFPPLG